MRFSVRGVQVHGMRGVWDTKCVGCRTRGIRGAWDAGFVASGCVGSGVRGMWGAWDAGCVGFRMHRTWGAWDASADTAASVAAPVPLGPWEGGWGWGDCRMTL